MGNEEFVKKVYRKSPMYKRVRDLLFIEFSYIEAIFPIRLLINSWVMDEQLKKKKNVIKRRTLKTRKEEEEKEEED